MIVTQSELRNGYRHAYDAPETVTRSEHRLTALVRLLREQWVAEQALPERDPLYRLSATEAA